MVKKKKKITEAALIKQINKAAKEINNDLFEERLAAEIRASERGDLNISAAPYPAEQGSHSNDYIQINSDDHTPTFQEATPVGSFERGFYNALSQVFNTGVIGTIILLKSPQALQAIKTIFTP